MQLDYTGLKLEYEITANGAGNQNIIKVLTDKGDVDVPDMPIVEQNKYQSVTLAIPDGASYIQFTSEESTNTSGYRIDNVSLTGIAKWYFISIAWSKRLIHIVVWVC